MSEEAAAKRPRFNFDVSFQLRMVRVLYQDEDFTTTVGSYLSPDHFEKKLHRWLVKQILDYNEQYGHGIGKTALRLAADRALKAGRLQPKDQPRLQTLIERIDKTVPEKSYIKEEVFSFVKNQVTRDMILASLDHLDNQDFAAIDQEMSKVLSVTEHMASGLGTRFVTDRLERKKRRKGHVKNGIATGTGLDEYHKYGGHRPKELAVILAPPGAGKTGTLVHIGKSAVVETEGKCRVLHVTLELGQDVMEDRYDAAFAKVPLNLLEKKRIEVSNAVKELGKLYGEFLVIKEYPPATLSVAGLRAYIRQLERAAFYPDMVIVDYADLMLPSRQYNDAYDEAGNIYQELRKMAVELRIPVWTASQANRAALNKEIISIESLAESFKKAMVADWIAALCQTKEEKKRKQVRFFIAKNRNGPQDLAVTHTADWSRQVIR